VGRRGARREVGKDRARRTRILRVKPAVDSISNERGNVDKAVDDVEKQSRERSSEAEAASCRAMDSRPPPPTTIFSSRRLAAVRTGLVSQISPAPAPARTHTCFHACVCSCPRLPNAGPRRPCPCPHRACAYSYTLAHARAPTPARANSLSPLHSRSPASSCLQHVSLLTPPRPPDYPLNHLLPPTPTILRRRFLRRSEALSLEGGQRCARCYSACLSGWLTGTLANPVAANLVSCSLMPSSLQDFPLLLHAWLPERTYVRRSTKFMRSLDQHNLTRPSVPTSSAHLCRTPLFPTSKLAPTGELPHVVEASPTRARLRCSRVSVHEPRCGQSGQRTSPVAATVLSGCLCLSSTAGTPILLRPADRSRCSQPYTRLAALSTAAACTRALERGRAHRRAPQACSLNGGTHPPSCPRTQYFRPRRVLEGTRTSTLLMSVVLSALSTAAFAFHFLDGARSHASSATPARPRSQVTSPVRLDRASRALTRPLSYYWTRALRLRFLPARAGALDLPRKGLGAHKHLKRFSFLARLCTLYRLFPSLHLSPRGSLEGPYTLACVFQSRLALARLV
jgi:hypothetical protein